MTVGSRWRTKQYMYTTNSLIADQRSKSDHSKNQALLNNAPLCSSNTMVAHGAIAISKVLLLSGTLSTSHGFVSFPAGLIGSSTQLSQASTTYANVDQRTGKSTGTSFLPLDAIERAEKGNPIEKIKLAKDGTSAFVDVYEYAAKIRAGEMTWEEIEAADLNTVSGHLKLIRSSFRPATLNLYRLI